MLFQTCGPAPTDLDTCKTLQTAYTSRTVYYKTTEEIITKGEYVSCICPEGHSYVSKDHRFDDLDEDTELMEVNYACAPVSGSVMLLVVVLLSLERCMSSRRGARLLTQYSEDIANTSNVLSQARVSRNPGWIRARNIITCC